MFRTGIAGFAIRFAREDDCELILQMIRELAEYEKLGDEVTATVDILRKSLFDRKQAEVLIGEANGVPVAFALFFHNFSTFLGKAGLYLEDLYVREAVRGNGYGKALLQCLACIALMRGCERLDWWCLDWNRSAIDFYHSVGHRPWTTGLFTGCRERRWLPFRMHLVIRAVWRRSCGSRPLDFRRNKTNHPAQGRVVSV